MALPWQLWLRWWHAVSLGSPGEPEERSAYGSKRHPLFLIAAQANLNRVAEVPLLKHIAGSM